MVKTNGMLPGADYFLFHASLVFDDRKSQPLIAGAVQRIRGRWQGGEVGAANGTPALRPQFVANVTIWWRVWHHSSECRTPAVALQRWRQGAEIQPENPWWTIHQVQPDLSPPSSFLISASSFTSVSSFSVRNVNTATVTATS